MLNNQDYIFLKIISKRPITKTQLSKEMGIAYKNVWQRYKKLEKLFDSYIHRHTQGSPKYLNINKKGIRVLNYLESINELLKGQGGKQK